MRNLAKYFLALAVMGGGFYAAQQYRHPNGNAPGGTVAMREATADSFSGGGQRPPVAAAATPLPVAALADVDRVPLLGADGTKTPGRSALSEKPGVTKQPTLRSDGPAEPPSSAPSAQKAGPATTSDAPKAGSKEQGEVKSKPKKQNPKKTETAKNRDKDFVPPDLAREYRPRAERSEIVKEPSSQGPEDAARQDGVSAANASPQPELQEAPPAAKVRRHRIAEGDTLARLAEQYLGSRDRYLELFQANADVLFDPRLIPIGVEIVIPDRTTIIAQAAATPATVDDAAQDCTPPASEAPATP
jgi:nucleoid-associated protein YgaU